ncbi:hypothetical protein BY458DRAFT_540765 [Sporodiniella umbellata]|nr:hypothetical protein BY458DRAFT_540765 [Sporodiniella umbellata]
MANQWCHNRLLSPEKTPFDDFVLLSEFSEIEGPLPLLIIIQNTCIDLKQSGWEMQVKQAGLETFDLNAFVLRVVSVDRTTTENEQQGTFSIPDDSQVYFTDKEQQFSAFTHHLTLFDIHARGYVHPVSLSYITQNASRMMIQLDSLMSQFHLLSLHLKRGNYANFMLDLKCRLLDLDYTRTQKILPAEAIEQAETLTRFILETLETTLPTVDSPPDYKPTCIDTLYPMPQMEKKLRSLAQLCQKPSEVIPLAYSIMAPQVSQPRHTFSNSVMEDVYQQMIEDLKEMTHSLSHDYWSESIEPTSSSITIGRTFMLDFDYAQTNSSTSENQEAHNEPTYPLLFNACQLKEIPLLGVLNRYRPLMTDVLFSLLTGRTVVVQGHLKNKNLIQGIVRAFSVFVPGQSQERHQVIEWFEKEKLTDIEGIKLVGIGETKMDTSIHSSCILDIEQNTLRSSPVYVEGQWIHQCLDQTPYFSTDGSYIAYLHTVFMDMSLKAHIYHHLYKADNFPMGSACSKGYTSDNNSEAGSVSSSTSTLSRKWSQRLLKYLRNQGDEGDDEDENQATITLKKTEEPTRSLTGLFNPPPTTTTTTTTTTRKSSMSSTDSLLSMGSLEDVLSHDFISQEFIDSDDDQRRDSIGPDGVSFIERRGRRFLEEKLKVYGDDQTIVVYLATQL